MENKLRHIIREIISEELNEMARIPTMLIIGDATKLEHAKRLYDDETFWVRKMIDAVEAAGETGISRMGYEIEGGEYIDGLTDIADKSQLLVNPKIKDLINIGLFAESGSIIPKKVKSTEVGQRGRKVGNKTLVAKEVNSKLEADNEYQANEAELETLGVEFIEKLRMRVKGTLKRGRKANPAKSTDGMVAVRNAMNSEEELEDMNDESFDPLVYDDDEDENPPLNEQFTRKQKPLNKQLKPMKKPLNEEFKRMQKLAGLNENNRREDWIDPKEWEGACEHYFNEYGLFDLKAFKREVYDNGDAQNNLAFVIATTAGFKGKFADLIKNDKFNIYCNQLAKYFLLLYGGDMGVVDENDPKYKEELNNVDSWLDSHKDDATFDGATF